MLETSANTPMSASQGARRRRDPFTTRPYYLALAEEGEVALGRARLGELAAAPLDAEIDNFRVGVRMAPRGPTRGIRAGACQRAAAILAAGVAQREITVAQFGAPTLAKTTASRPALAPWLPRAAPSGLQAVRAPGLVNSAEQDAGRARALPAARRPAGTPESRLARTVQVSRGVTGRRRRSPGRPSAARASRR